MGGKTKRKSVIDVDANRVKFPFCLLLQSFATVLCYSTNGNLQHLLHVPCHISTCSLSHFHKFVTTFTMPNCHETLTKTTHNIATRQMQHCHKTDTTLPQVRCFIATSKQVRCPIVTLQNALLPQVRCYNTS